MMQLPPIRLSKSFYRAQVSSLLSTLADFLVTHLLTGLFGLWYLFSSITGTILGGLVNFLLGRYWTFKVTHRNKLSQARKYVIIWAGSLLLNTLGVYLFTEVIGLHYLLSKALTSITVGIFFNFYFQKTFVFKS